MHIEHTHVQTIVTGSLLGVFLKLQVMKKNVRTIQISRYVNILFLSKAQDKGRWRAVMNAVMNLRVLAPKSSFISCLKEDTTFLHFEGSL
jgi:hypothetical protein